VASLSILVSAVLFVSCGQSDTQTESHTDAANRYTHATTVIVSNIIIINYSESKICLRLIISTALSFCFFSNESTL